MYGECERCPKEPRKLGIHETITLAGGIVAVLCPPHLRGWHVAVSATDAWAERTEVSARYEAAVSGGDEDRAAVLAAELAVVMRAFADFALAWLAEEPACEICGELHPEGDDGCVDGEQDL